MKKPKTGVKVIGLVMEDIFTEFAREIMNGVISAVKEDENIRLVVLSGRQNEDNNPNDKRCQYKNVYNSVYMLEEFCPFDGLILTFPNLFGSMENSKLLENFGNFARIPKVYVATRKENDVTVNYNNEPGICEAIDYLVNIRGITKLCMLGGRDDNSDANDRRRIFQQCLADNHLPFTEDMYEKTDMSINTVDAAERLLDRNPDVQAIFCVNDPVAIALYEAMDRRGLVPGKDILVFGFDNTYTASLLVPPLASIGPADITLGQKALELLLELLEGNEPGQVELPTRLYGRESCPYEMYEYTTRGLETVDPAFINRMFDDCFYRYKSEHIDSRSINLKRLYFEFLSRMLYATNYRYMSAEEYDEIGRMIDIFFENGAMNYTDPTKFLSCIQRLQNGINFAQKSVYANLRTNRLFSRMKDRAIQTMAKETSRRNGQINLGRERALDFQIETMAFGDVREGSVEGILKCFDKLNLRDAALYLFERPVDYEYGKTLVFPETIRLCCVMKAGELYVLPEERRDCRMSEMFVRKELPLKTKGFVAFSVFYGNRIYGFLLSRLTEEIYTRGEYLVGLLSRALYINDRAVDRNE